MLPAPPVKLSDHDLVTLAEFWDEGFTLESNLELINWWIAQPVPEDDPPY